MQETGQVWERTAPSLQLLCVHGLAADPGRRRRARRAHAAELQECRDLPFRRHGCRRARPGRGRSARRGRGRRESTEPGILQERRGGSGADPGPAATASGEAVSQPGLQNCRKAPAVQHTCRGRPVNDLPADPAARWRQPSICFIVAAGEDLPADPAARSQRRRTARTPVGMVGRQAEPQGDGWRATAETRAGRAVRKDGMRLAVAVAHGCSRPGSRTEMHAPLARCGACARPDDRLRAAGDGRRR